MKPIDLNKTPQTLDEAIQHTLAAVCIGDPSEIGDKAYYVMRDFLAQAFGAAYLLADEAELLRLQVLFERLTTRAK